jgi:hypothetical protein
MLFYYPINQNYDKVLFNNIITILAAIEGGFRNDRGKILRNSQ